MFILNIVFIASIFPLVAQELPFTSYLQYGIAGIMAVLLYFVFKHIVAASDKRNADREERILAHNKQREESYTSLVKSVKDLIGDLDKNWKSTADRMDRNYQDSIDKFIKVIDKVMDQNSYTTQILVELKDKIEHFTKKNDVDEMKKEILAALNKIVLEYNLTPKNRSQQ